MIDYNNPEVIKLCEILYQRYNYYKTDWTTDQKAAALEVLYSPTPSEDPVPSVHNNRIEPYAYTSRKAAKSKMKDLDLHTYTVALERLRAQGRHYYGVADWLEVDLRHRVIGLPEKHPDYGEAGAIISSPVHSLTWRKGITKCSVAECEVNNA